MKSLVLFLMVLVSSNSFAKSGVTNIVCEGQKEDLQIYIDLGRMTVGEDKKSAKIESHSMTIIIKSYSDEVVPNVSAASSEGKDLTNVEYEGRKYQGHLKFPIFEHGQHKMVGNMGIEYADLIINPEYTVVKETQSGNHWDKTWTWVDQVRKHSAVLSISINDHHGDYVKLNCFSSGIVDEKRGKN